MQLCNGCIIQTDDTAVKVVSYKETTNVQPVVFFDTGAFEAIVGTTFLQFSHCGGLLTKSHRPPCKIF